MEVKPALAQASTEADCGERRGQCGGVKGVEGRTSEVVRGFIRGAKRRRRGVCALFREPYRGKTDARRRPTEPWSCMDGADAI